MSDLSRVLEVAVYQPPNERVAIHLVGSLDTAGAARFVDAVTSIELTGGGDLAIHADAVESLDSAGIRALFYAEALVRVHGGGVVLVSPSRDVQLALEEEAVGEHFQVETEAGHS